MTVSFVVLICCFYFWILHRNWMLCWCLNSGSGWFGS